MIEIIDTKKEAIIKIDDREIKNVTDYSISSNSKMAEITIKMVLPKDDIKIQFETYLDRGGQNEKRSEK